MSLVIHYWIGDVQDSQGVFASEMTYIVSGGALNSTHSLTPKLWSCPKTYNPGYVPNPIPDKKTQNTSKTLKKHHEWQIYNIHINTPGQ